MVMGKTRVDMIPVDSDLSRGRPALPAAGGNPAVVIGRSRGNGMSGPARKRLLARIARLRKRLARRGVTLSDAVLEERNT